MGQRRPELLQRCCYHPEELLPRVQSLSFKSAVCSALPAQSTAHLTHNDMTSRVALLLLVAAVCISFAAAENEVDSCKDSENKWVKDDQSCSKDAATPKSRFVDQLHSKVQRAQALKDEEKLYRYKGVLYPAVMCPEEHLRALENLQARHDDILLVAYPKCGFNWIWSIAGKMVAAAKGANAVSKMPPLMEFFGPELLKVVGQSPSPRVLGTHLHPDNIPPSFYTSKTKMLVMFRNPKDTLVSMYHFSKNNPIVPSVKSWESFYRQFMTGDVPWGSYFDQALAWEQRMSSPNVMVITYEELKQDLERGVREMSQFFGFSLTEDQLKNISEQSTFSAMKDNSMETHGNVANVIFRKGEVGDWRSHFTPEQSVEMDQVFNKHLSGTRLGDKLNYQLHCQ